MSNSVERSPDEIDQETIESIAKEMHYPLPIVRQVYEAELARLKESARITDYLALFAARRTRDVLTSRDH